jgi:ubiquinol-cytochrome c reductase cytochrome c1 subunit
MRVLLLLLFFSQIALADLPPIALEPAHINRDDMDSVKRGAQFFASTCMSCHTLIYLRYDTFAQKAGIDYAKMPVNVHWPANQVPPDLSLEASVRGKDWIYTYLHSFYTDTTRPTGVNNLLVPNTMMPGIIVPFQGQQVLATDREFSKTLTHQWQWYDLLVLQFKGSLDSTQFDAMMNDVVNFLCYASEPYHQQQTRLGWKVIIFLCVFFVLAWLLKREYWKDVE